MAMTELALCPNFSLTLAESSLPIFHAFAISVTSVCKEDVKGV